MIVDKLEDTLNGGFGGLYGEVVVEDSYGLRKIKKQIDVVIDIGANVGCFTRFARELFPKAKIIAVEPDMENFIHLQRFTDSPNISFLRKAIGYGRIFKVPGAPNGAHESYLSESPGLPYKYLIENNYPEQIETCMLDELFNQYVLPGDKVIVKIDCEGAENLIWTHKPSMNALKRADYIMLELHYAVAVCDRAAVKDLCEKTIIGIMELTETHNCFYKHIYFNAIKKTTNGN
jgi:FkbM family methyltransferase